MNAKEAATILDDALAKLGEHFDAIQIHASWPMADGATGALHRGTGNWFARESLCRRFVQESQVIIMQQIKPDSPDEGDNWKAGQ